MGSGQTVVVTTTTPPPGQQRLIAAKVMFPMQVKLGETAETLLANTNFVGAVKDGIATTLTSGSNEITADMLTITSITVDSGSVPPGRRLLLLEEDSEKKAADSTSTSSTTSSARNNQKMTRTLNDDEESETESASLTIDYTIAVPSTFDGAAVDSISNRVSAG